VKNAHRLKNLLQMASKQEDIADIGATFDPEVNRIVPVLVPLMLIDGYDEDYEALIEGDLICFKDLSALLRFEDKLLVLDMDQEEDTIMFRVIIEVSKKYLHKAKPQNRELH
jgi:hypothetical protein